MKNKILLLLTVILSNSHFLSAQTTFQKRYGSSLPEVGMNGTSTNDGGYIIAGTIQTTGNYPDIYLIKTNSTGALQWTKIIAGALLDEAIYIKQTADQGFIITGGTKSFGAGDMDVFLIKTDSTGNITWKKTYGGTFYDKGFSVQQTFDGGYIVAGITQNFGAINNNHFYLIKTDNAGDTLWTRTFGDGTGDEAYSVQQTTDSCYVVAGTTATLGTGNWDVLVIKTNTSGNLLWSKTYGSPEYDFANLIKKTVDDGFIIVGRKFTLSTSNDDIYLIKIDSAGNLQWAHIFGGTSYDWAVSAQQTADDGYVLAGNTGSFGTGGMQMYLIKTDVLGNILSSNVYGGVNSASAYAINQVADKGYFLSGFLNFPGSNSEMYLVKTDSLGSSGCFESTVSTISTLATLQTTVPTPSVYSGGIVTTPAFTVSNGGIENTFCISTGINQFYFKNPISVFPNPANNSFTIELDDIKNKVEIKIYNTIGEIVYFENIFNESKKDINMDKFAGGIYFVKLFDGENSYCKKVIIE